MSDDDDKVVQFKSGTEIEPIDDDKFLIEEGFDLLASFRQLSPALRKQIFGLILTLLAEKNNKM